MIGCCDHVTVGDVIGRQVVLFSFEASDCLKVLIKVIAGISVEPVSQIWI